MSHLQPPHKSFARYASVLRENLIACDTSLRKGEEDWQATLGRLNAAFNQTKNLNDIIENSYEHVVYIPKKCTANIQDVASFLSCRCTPDSIVSSSTSSTSSGVVGRMKNGDGRKRHKTAVDGDGGGVDGGEEGELDDEEEKERTPKLLQRYEHKVYELASEFEEGMVRF
ncbi:hypothetical protein ACHAXH_001297 [Discostella pseudostelligera]